MSRRDRKPNKSTQTPEKAPDAPLAPVETAADAATDDAKIREKDDHEYEKHVATLETTRGQTATEYDRWLLTLSGTALGLSLTFIKELVPHDKPWAYAGWLYASWASFAAATAIILTNIQLSYSAFGKYVKIANQEYKRYTQREISRQELWDGMREKQNGVKRNAFIESFNWINLALFLIGIAGLITFVWANHPNGPEQTMTRTNATVPASAPAQTQPKTVTP